MLDKPTSIKQMFQGMAEAGMPEIVTGVVIETSPIQIALKDDPNIRISAVSLIIPSGKLPLVLGEELYLLAVSNRKVYYIMDRV